MLESPAQELLAAFDSHDKEEENPLYTFYTLNDVSFCFMGFQRVLDCITTSLATATLREDLKVECYYIALMYACIRIYTNPDNYSKHMKSVAVESLQLIQDALAIIDEGMLVHNRHLLTLTQLKIFLTGITEKEKGIETFRLHLQPLMGTFLKLKL